MNEAKRTYLEAIQIASGTSSASCDASLGPEFGAPGDCTATLLSGSTCQPVCQPGFTVSGTSSCNNGVVSAATCDPPACDDSTTVAAHSDSGGIPYSCADTTETEKWIRPCMHSDTIKFYANIHAAAAHRGQAGDTITNFRTDNDFSCSTSDTQNDRAYEFTEALAPCMPISL